jgi:high affinity Mn2+ porin
MGNPGKKANLWLDRGTPAHALRCACASFLLVFTGCTAGPPAVVLPEDFANEHSTFFPPSEKEDKLPLKTDSTLRSGQPAAETRSAGPDKAEDRPAKEPAEPAVPKPRTVPEAIHAYLKCLRSPKPDKEAKNGAEPAKAEEKEEQNNSKGEANQKEKKSPPAAGHQAEPKKSENGQEKQDAQGREEKGKEEKKEDKEKEEKKEEAAPAWYSAHAQATVVTQAHDHFHSPYIGPNSLLPVEPSATSMTGTVFLDARLWECCGNSTELIFNPEIAGGRGLSGTTGIAGFPNGEITRVGVPEPTPYIARLFVRQTLGLGGEQENIEDSANQIAGKRDINRLTLTVGKFSATDLVDDNRYSHDPRTQFLPWSIMYNGAWDYPANVRGYTYGVGIDYNTRWWALRYGVFAEPKFANSAEIDPKIDDANGHVLEFEQRYTLCSHPGKLRLLAYLNHAHMGKYSEALAEMPVNPDVTLTRAYRIKYGFGLSWEQELSKDLGVFGRLGWDDGHSESWAFTAIDRLAEIGLLLGGRCWCRPNDQVGLAFDANGLAKIHHEYLAAGGLDFIIGDGRLRYGLEQILEAYYNLSVIKGINVTLDFQEVFNPAYNRDRGPVSILALRVHFEL